MIASAVAAPAAIESGICFPRRGVSIPAGFASGLPSASRKFFPLTSTFYPVEKDVVCNSRAFEPRILAKFSTQAVADTKTESPKTTDAISRTERKERNPKRLNSSGSQMKRTDYFPVLQYPLATESAIKAMSENNTLIFAVDKRADKNTIKDEVKRIFNVRAKKVNTSITPDGNKKAFIMLAPEFVAGDVLKNIKVMSNQEDLKITEFSFFVIFIFYFWQNLYKMSCFA